MMSFFESLELHTVSILDTETTASATLSGSQVLANCMAWLVYKSASSSTLWYEQQASCRVAAGPDRVIVNRGGSSGVLTAVVCVAEFASGVQSGSFIIPSGQTFVDVPIAAVTLGKTFPVFSAIGGHYSPQKSMCNGIISLATQLTFTRGASDASTVTGYWFLLESSEIDVQSFSISMAGLALGTTPLSPVDMLKTFLVSSANMVMNSRDPDELGMRVWLSAADEASAARGLANGFGYTVSGYAVTFPGDVQRGMCSWLDTEGDQTSPISAVNVANTIPWIPNPFCGTVSDSSSVNDLGQVLSNVNLDDPTTVRQSRGTNVSAGSANYETLQFPSKVSPIIAPLVGSNF